MAGRRPMGIGPPRVRRPLTPGLISSSSGTAGLPPFISFSTSYPELRPVPNCMARRGQGAGNRRGQGALMAVLVSRHAEPSAAADRAATLGVPRRHAQTGRPRLSLSR